MVGERYLHLCPFWRPRVCSHMGRGALIIFRTEKLKKKKKWAKNKKKKKFTTINH